MTESACLGPSLLPDGGCRFRVWAPFAERVDLHLLCPEERVLQMIAGEGGYREVTVDHVAPGTFYRYRLCDRGLERPDPCSHDQPDGVHGASRVVTDSFDWDDQTWRGRALEQYVIYELHVGTFTEPGTFDAAIPQLARLADLGLTAIELMPVASFPGRRNWGYDGVFPYAVQHSYGGPAGLKRFVNACHRHGLAVVLDVVYNHLGPEGNCLGDFGPYFTDRHKTPWGQAINFDGPQSDHVRRYFVENALRWVTEFHIDALRLDAVHAIVDQSAYPFIEQLTEAVHDRARQLGRSVWVMAESARNDPRLVRSRQDGGYGLDAQWNDDFHHALHGVLTGERAGYYVDFGPLAHLAKALTDGFVYSGEYSVFRRRRFGQSSRDIPAHRFVVCAQNHDQVGNRLAGDRLARLVGFEPLKLAAGVVGLSPFIPLLFMGEEYAETAPFLYFVSHSDAALVQEVRRGRREEFSAFDWHGEPPDPQDEQTFLRSKLNTDLRAGERNGILMGLWKRLLELRRTLPALANLSKDHMDVQVFEDQNLLLVRRFSGSSHVLAVFHFGLCAVQTPPAIPAGSWYKCLDSSDPMWAGVGSGVPQRVVCDGRGVIPMNASSFVLFSRTNGR